MGKSGASGKKVGTVRTAVGLRKRRVVVTAIVAVVALAIGVPLVASAVSGGLAVPFASASTATVSFDTGDGGSKVDSQTVASGGHAAKPATTPTRSGYVFGGWYTSADGGKTLSTMDYDFKGAAVSGDTVLYAKWLPLQADPNAYTVVYHANGGTLSGASGTDATYSQSIKAGKKTAKLDAVKFTAPSGKRFAFWTLGKSDADAEAAAVDSTVTDGVKDVTTLTYVDGHDLSHVDGTPDKSSSKAVEMYTDSSTSTSKTEAVAGDTVNLYAHWIDSSLGSYWMAPSKKLTTSNKDSYSAADVAEATKANENYVSPETGDNGAAAVYKDNAGVKSAVAALKSEIEAGSETTLQDQWTTVMNEDRYHLYTLYKEDRPLAFDERYVESRVINVGAHGDDGTTLTFEAVHSLPTAYRMNTTELNTGGWAASGLRGKMNDDGAGDSDGNAVYENFEEAYVDDLVAAQKWSHRGTVYKSDTVTEAESSDKFWVLSFLEITGEAHGGFLHEDASHGGQYGWYAHFASLDGSAAIDGSNFGDLNNSALVNANRTRSEGPVASAHDGDRWWERSPNSSGANLFASVHGGYGIVDYNYYPDCFLAVHPAFAM